MRQTICPKHGTEKRPTFYHGYLCSRCLECGRLASRAWAKSHLDYIKQKRRKDYAQLKVDPNRLAKYRAKRSERAKNRRQDLIDPLLKQVVSNAYKIPSKDVPPELIALRREQIKAHRLIKQTKEKMKYEKETRMG